MCLCLEKRPASIALLRHASTYNPYNHHEACAHRKAGFLFHQRRSKSIFSCYIVSSQETLPFLFYCFLRCFLVGAAAASAPEKADVPITEESKGNTKSSASGGSLQRGTVLVLQLCDSSTQLSGRLQSKVNE